MERKFEEFRGIHTLQDLSERGQTLSKGKIVITGGAGFIGINAARSFQLEGYDVVIVDNLSRRGTKENLESDSEN